LKELSQIQFNQRLEMISIERDIRHMETELAYHRENTRIFEEKLQKQQHILGRMQRKIQREFKGDCTNE